MIFSEEKSPKITFHASSRFSFEPLNNHDRLFIDTINQIFDICCPVEMLFLCNGREVSPKLKASRRRKKQS